jgi:hypothetical protein
MTDAFPPVGSPGHPLPQSSTPKEDHHRRKSLETPKSPVFSTPRGTPQRTANNTTLGEISRTNDDRERNDEKTGDDPAPYITLLPRDTPDDGYLSPSLISPPPGKRSTFVGDFFFRSSKNKGTLLPMYSTSLALEEGDGRDNKEKKKVGLVTLEDRLPKDLVKLGTVMNSTKSDGELPIEKFGTLEEDRESDDDARSDTSSQAAAMMSQTQVTVSFDRFAQWFLGLARELGNRAGGRRHGRKKGGRGE